MLLPMKIWRFRELYRHKKQSNSEPEECPARAKRHQGPIFNGGIAGASAEGPCKEGGQWGLVGC